MFTGIVEDIATILHITPVAAGRKLVVKTKMKLEQLRLGDSIAVNGVCLTATSCQNEGGSPSTWIVSFDVGPETLSMTTLGKLRTGDHVHVEQALRLADRLGGHLVQGHVDGVGSLKSKGPEGSALRLTFAAPPEVLRYCIYKGAVAIDGVSLTINRVHTDGFDVCLVPHTLENTRFASVKVGDDVNLEADMIGKYVERLLLVGQQSQNHAGQAGAYAGTASSSSDSSLLAALQNAGFMKS